MPKFYCEYCGIYLTHSSPLGRKQHAEGRKHIQNKIDYYSNLLMEAQRESTQYISNDTLFKFFGRDKKQVIDNIMNSENQNKVISKIEMTGIAPGNISVVPLNGNQMLSVQNSSQNPYQINLSNTMSGFNSNTKVENAQMRNPFSGQ